MEQIARQIATNTALLTRQAIAAKAGKQFGGDRDLYKVLGYQKTLEFDEYLAKYERQDIAGSIVDIPAEYTWQNDPKITTEEGEDSEFVKDWESLEDRLDAYSYMARLDRLSGIGEYGVMFIGVKTDGDDSVEMFKEEVTEVKLDDILYLRVFHQGKADIEEWVTNHNDPLYGFPLIYKLQMRDFEKEAKGRSTRDVYVHRSRIIHKANDPLDDEIYGRPRLQRVFNLMDDLTKIAGGSAEMFWQNVASTIHASLDPELEYEADDLKDLEEKVFEMLLGLRKFIQTEGVDLETLGDQQTPDPRGVWEVIKALIAATEGIPQRILFGSERGELASSQDMATWHGKIAGRQTNEAEPHILRKFIDRLVSWKALTPPKEGYDITWPPLKEETMEEKADTAKSQAEAASTYSPGSPETVISPREFRETLGYPGDMDEDDLKEIEQQQEEEAEDGQEDVIDAFSEAAD